MFLHLGGDVLTDLSNIIVIINSENPIGVSSNAEFLKNASVKRQIQNIDNENNKAIIITDKKVYTSPISAHTLKKRADFMNGLV